MEIQDYVVVELTGEIGMIVNKNETARTYEVRLKNHTIVKFYDFELRKANR
jgi:hypothetical protein